jgi:superfamily I DNA and RNA helicase
MQLHNINKARYRKHLNIVIVVGIIALTTLSLGLSQSAIYLFTDREGSHFWLNLAGVAIAMVIIGSVLNKYKDHTFMTEVYYVWRLKQQINYIHRKNKKINEAVERDEVNAMLIMAFYYKACRQLYELDDNTITLSSLNSKSNELETKIAALNLTIDTTQYEQSLLQGY